MINKLKLYIILGLIGLIIGTIVYYSTTYTFIKKKEVKQKTDSISTLKREVVILDSLAWSLQQDIDIAKKNEEKFQLLIAEQKKRASEALAAEKQAIEAIEHYENNGLMRYFKFDPNGIFKKGCYREVFIKPDNICK